jgi:hypothetical protein
MSPLKNRFFSRRAQDTGLKLATLLEGEDAHEKV